MTAQAPRLTFSVDPLIAEAKRRMRRRRLVVLLVLLAAGAAAAGGLIGARSPSGVETSLPWNRGHSTQMRYCRRPDSAGAYLAASASVTCQAAGAVERALTSRCYSHGGCAVGSFRCVSYFAGRYGGTFAVYHHALCSAGSRRVEWDGG